MPTIPLRKSCEHCFNLVAEEVERACLRVQRLASPKLYEGADRAEFVAKRWRRKGGGGGNSRIMRGGALEKVGVNSSVVFGDADEKMLRVATAKGLRLDPSPRFWAAGVSVVIHPLSPLLPTFHMNLRRVEVGDEGWFGGGADITPMLVNSPAAKADAALLHRRLREACDGFARGCYARFAKNCDEYFYLPHRREPRGLGGIFYDDLAPTDERQGVALATAVGEAFTTAFGEIAARRLNHRWNEAEKRQQMMRRGRYVEFNLLYDRGTHFGILTNADPDAVLMSLPPLASW